MFLLWICELRLWPGNRGAGPFVIDDSAFAAAIISLVAIASFAHDFFAAGALAPVAVIRFALDDEYVFMHCAQRQIDRARQRLAACWAMDFFEHNFLRLFEFAC